ncbi:hypothetical protein CAEBREN_11273 [Caenorhabditis brenneri]|uniref:Glycosyltransferase family 92 protein n=1 Tax=Caenorhabditis brenneri TaxID=135651 RepID=G0PMM7_CAEBE|nr:hypothetical protein CAEBREN_11273 [Caenorhabditis brenneri]
MEHFTFQNYIFTFFNNQFKPLTVKQKKYALVTVIIVCLILLFFVGTLETGVIVDPTRRLSRILPVSHVFLTSAYYYPISSSLGANAIALNMVVDSVNFNVDHATYSMVGSNGTFQKLTVAASKVEGDATCRYKTVMASTNTLPNLKKLEMESHGLKVQVNLVAFLIAGTFILSQIPFKMARYTAPKPVIICISPQFVAEQWQMFLMNVHVANRFGAHLHVYITSMIESYFELMKEYERKGYLTLDYWLRMKFSRTETPYFEPNGNVEWRNQAGAETDCLLQYKEAVDYIAFFDIDDILFPASYPTYLEEFNAEWTLQPNATSLYYGRREHEYIKAQSISEFNLTEIVGNLRSSPTIKQGKIVVKPSMYNHTWIQYNFHKDPAYRFELMFVNVNNVNVFIG